MHTYVKLCIKMYTYIYTHMLYIVIIHINSYKLFSLVIPIYIEILVSTRALSLRDVAKVLNTAPSSAGWIRQSTTGRLND